MGSICQPLRSEGYDCSHLLQERHGAGGVGGGRERQVQEISWAATRGGGGKLVTSYGNGADKDRARNKLTG